jgi:RimJ/RimL family protein N-acetyltransferase/4'-phosphopantetheinyl transferase EntD
MQMIFPYLSDSTALQLAFVGLEEPSTLSLDELCPEDQDRFQNFSTELLKAQFLSSRQALKNVLPSNGLKNVFFEGKRPMHPEGNLSLSHCKAGAVGVFSENLMVGIDLETTRTQLSRIASKFVRDDEQPLLASLGEQKALQCIWGIKESLFKLYGKGGLDFKAHLKISSLQRHSSDTSWVGMAWIVNHLHSIPCLVQCREEQGNFLCLATHRPAMKPLPGQRIHLREWTLDDAPWLFELNSDPEVIAFTGDSGFSSLAEATDLIQTYENYQRDGFGRWMVIDNLTSEPLGWCGLKQNDWGVDLGFRFFKKHWNQGFATEAANIVLKWADERKIGPIVGRSLSGNSRSISVLEKLGFVCISEEPMEHLKELHGITSEEFKRWKEMKLLVFKRPDHG